MPSRQDQLHSYQFMVQRVVAALVMRETDPAQSPFRRGAGATLASVLVAAIALGAVGVYGVVVGGDSQRWRDTSAVIVEKESGARFIYRDDKLHPVLNYASGLLIIGSSRPKTVLVSRKSLEGVPRGTALGIQDAPDSLPAREQLVGAPWTVCSGAVTENGSSATRSMLYVGTEPSGGSPLGDKAVLARNADDSYLIYRNRRHLVRDASTVLAALGWTSTRPVPVSSSLLNTLDVGRTLGRISIDRRGAPSRVAVGAKIGQVFVTELQGGGRQYAVAVQDGLAPITQVQADIVLTDPRTALRVGQTEPTEMSQSEFARAHKLPAIGVSGGTAPSTTPDLANTDGAICAVVHGDAGVSVVRTGVAVPDLSDAARTASRTSSGAVLADYVFVEPGRGALVQAANGPSAGGAISIVTDLGQRYAVAGQAVQGMLGYGEIRPVRLPASVVALLPSGPALDPEQAAAPVAAR
jgi:type VII secretion protein EccB